MKSIVFTLACFSITMSCETVKTKNSIRKSISSDETSAIKPIKGLEIPERTFKIKANENSIIHLSNGGSIEIPKNSLVNKNGEAISGNVEVKWKEFHSLTDILLSGIPMKYDSAGTSYDFVSGGMFTISAKQNNEELVLKEGKQIDVNLASVQEKTNFNFYELNEKTGVWSYDTTVAGKKNVKFQEDLEQEDHSTIIDAQVDLTQFPDLQNQEIVGWRSLDELSFNDKKIIKHATSKVTLSFEKSNYILNFKRKQNNLQVRVKPYLLSEALQADKKIKTELKVKYDELLEYQNNLVQGKVIRSIAIKNFGTYNWDCPYSPQNAKVLSAKFDYGKSTNPKLVNVFLISLEENLIIPYTSEKVSKFKFNTKSKNCLVAILPDNRIFFVSNKSLDKARSAPQNSNFTFKFRDLGIKVNSGEELGTCILNIAKQSS